MSKPFDDYVMFRDYADVLARFREQAVSRYGAESTSAFLRRIIRAANDGRLKIEPSKEDMELQINEH